MLHSRVGFDPCHFDPYLCGHLVIWNFSFYYILFVDFGQFDTCQLTIGILTFCIMILNILTKGISTFDILTINIIIESFLDILNLRILTKEF